MNANPFASFNVEIPKKYRDSVISYSRTGGNKNTPEYAPFKRQVDFWYLAFLVGISKGLDPEPDSDTYNATPATIFSSDPYRINHMLLAYLGVTQDVESLANHRAVFDYCLGVANAGMPYLIQIMADPDERPLWSLFDELEGLVA
ncbi:MAG: hypothetical protein DRR42_05175 [Gammaproteobacteria bacterium]|nr:MAG: hypothetical protein DRR42_05175 [Gammaproteobacteria bacterium]